MINAIKIFTDGGCAGNDAHGAGCFVVVKANRIEHIICEYVDAPITNNVAEYIGMINAILWCRWKMYNNVTISSDSQLVIRQLLGMYDVKSPNLVPYHQLAKSLSQGMNITFEWVPRTNLFVREADRTCDRAIALRRHIHA